MQPRAQFEADFAEFVRGALAGDQWVIWIAESEGRIVAHVYVHVVGMVPRPGDVGRRWGYAAGAYTVPEARNQGIGSRLLRGVIDWSREEGLEFLQLSPTDRSISFYERAGFVRSPNTMELNLDS